MVRRSTLRFAGSHWCRHAEHLVVQARVHTLGEQAPRSFPASSLIGCLIIAKVTPEIIRPVLGLHNFEVIANLSVGTCLLLGWRPAIAVFTAVLLSVAGTCLMLAEFMNSSINDSHASAILWTLAFHGLLLVMLIAISPRRWRFDFSRTSVEWRFLTPVWAGLGSGLLYLACIGLIGREAGLASSIEVGDLYLEQSHIDLGLVEDAEFATATFHLENRGSSDLKIRSIKPECSCTVVQPDRLTIGPRQSVALPATIDVGAVPRTGGLENTHFKKSILITFEPLGTERSRSVRLSIVGMVPGDTSLKALPGVLDCGKVRPGEVVTRQLEFRGLTAVLDAIPESIRVPISNNVHGPLRLAFSTSGNDGNESYGVKQVRFDIAFSSELSESHEQIRSALEIAIDDLSAHHLSIPVRGHVLADSETHH